MPAAPRGGAVTSKEIASYNCTSWRSGLRFLREVHACVAVVLLQEHRLLATDAVVGAVAAASHAGWHLLVEPAVPSRAPPRPPATREG